MPSVYNAEEAVAHLAAVVESSEDAIISKTLEGIILTWNTGAEHIYGYPAEETVGRPMALLLPEDRAQEETSILQRIRSGERVEHFETVRKTKNGALIDVSLTISPIRDRRGQVVGVSHIARDISDRKGLHERLEQLASLVDSSEDAIISKTVEGIILTWNMGAEHIYGYPAAEVVGRPMTLLLPADRADEEAEVLERIRKGERVDHFETVRRAKNGDLIDVSLTISPIRSRQGQITGASHVARNITDRKRFDEQLRHAQKLESLGVLAGGVAHDFNNLLTGILGNASLALETVSPSSPAGPMLCEVVSASERASHLTRQLLAYAGKGRFIIEPVNLSGLVREISSLIQTSISKNVQVRLDLQDDIPWIHADSSQLQQIVMNLVINGAEAIGEEVNGTVIVTTGVLIADEQYGANLFDGSAGLLPGRYVSLEVHDSGCGMDEPTIGRIFDPFFTTKFTGRGLGLAAVQGIVHGHKGALKVLSRPGSGTAFKVLFPAMEELAEPKSKPILHWSGHGELVLVVDDEEVVRRTAKMMLERYGYTVVVAVNGKEGVDLFKVLGEKVAAVLLDMTMPVMNGEEALRYMREINPSARVILSSGYSEVEAVRRFTGKGIAGFLQKPYSSVALAEKISTILQAPSSF